MRWLGGITDSMDARSVQTQGDSEGQGSLVCCNPWGHKELDTTEQLNNNNLNFISHVEHQFCRSKQT